MNFATTSDEGEGKGNETAVPSESEEEEEEEDYSELQYPPIDDKCRHLEECFNAMEIQRVPGLHFEELGLVSGIVIPPKIKVPLFAKYDGATVVPQNFPSHILQDLPKSSFKISQGLHSPIAS